MKFKTRIHVFFYKPSIRPNISNISITNLHSNQRIQLLVITSHSSFIQYTIPYPHYLVKWMRHICISAFRLKQSLKAVTNDVRNSSNHFYDHSKLYICAWRVKWNVPSLLPWSLLTYICSHHRLVTDLMFKLNHTRSTRRSGSVLRKFCKRNWWAGRKKNCDV